MDNINLPEAPEGCVFVAVRKDAVALIDKADLEKIQGYTWATSHRGYAYAYNKPRGFGNIFMHRVILGELPDGIHIDHINHDLMDNRRINLRAVRPCLNYQNSASMGVVPYKGVTKHRSRFRVRVYREGELFYRATFPTAEEAAKAYDREILKVHGSGVLLNFPDDYPELALKIPEVVQRPAACLLHKAEVGRGGE